MFNTLEKEASFELSSFRCLFLTTSEEKQTKTHKLNSLQFISFFFLNQHFSYNQKPSISSTWAMCALFSTLFPQNMQENKMLESKSQVLQGCSSALMSVLLEVLLASKRPK